MSPEIWGFYGLVVTQIGAIVVGWLQNRSTSKKVEDTSAKVDETMKAADEARELARPTGNGYANATLGLLHEIREHVSDVQEQISEVRTDVRDLRGEVKEDRQVMTRHIADHATGRFQLPQQRKLDDEEP